jgi:quercetin dioxygenase-like cupin family protein
MEKRSIKTTPEDPTIPTRPGWEGMHVWWLVSQAETGSTQIVFDIATFPPGKAHEVHRHPGCEEVTYVIEGSGLHLGDGDPVRQEVGDVCFIAQGEWHGFANDTDEPTTIIGVYAGVGSPEEAGYEVHPDEQAAVDG